MNETLGHSLQAACRTHARRPCLVHGDRTISYGELWKAVMALAAGYRRLGVIPGDRILCALPNTPEHVIAMGAAWAVGAIHAGVDSGLTASELSHLARQTAAAAMILPAAHAGQDPLAAVRGLRVDHPTMAVVTDGRCAEEGVTSLASLLEARCGEPDVIHADPESPAIILFSSGTTGRPKAVLGHHRRFVEGSHAWAEQLRLTPDDLHLGHLPIAHGFGLSMALAALLSGGCLVLTESFSAEPALRLIARHRITVLNGTPSHFILLTQRRDPVRHDVSSLRIGVGTAASFRPALLRRIYGELEMDLVVVYGCSEGAGVTSADREVILRGSVGRCEPGTVAVLDAQGRRLPPGEVGEIAFRRRRFDAQYWGEGDDDAHAGEPGLRDGDWYHTGDVGRLDTDGLLYVLGRSKHQVDRGGIKVDPGEVEEALVRCPEVADAAVTGTPNPVLGETVCACVVPRSGTRPTLTGLREALAPVLAAYKLPEELCVVSAIPRTVLGKIDRQALGAVVAAAGVRERLRDP